MDLVLVWYLAEMSCFTTESVSYPFNPARGVGLTAGFQARRSTATPPATAALVPLTVSFKSSPGRCSTQARRPRHKEP